MGSEMCIRDSERTVRKPMYGVRWEAQRHTALAGKRSHIPKYPAFPNSAHCPPLCGMCQRPCAAAAQPKRCRRSCLTLPPHSIHWLAHGPRRYGSCWSLILASYLADETTCHAAHGSRHAVPLACIVCANVYYPCNVPEILVCTQYRILPVDCHGSDQEIGVSRLHTLGDAKIT